MSRRSKRKSFRRPAPAGVSEIALPDHDIMTDQDLRETEHEPDTFLSAPAVPALISYSDDELRDDNANDLAFGLTAPSGDESDEPGTVEAIARHWLVLRLRMKAANIVRLPANADDIATEQKLRTDLIKALEAI